MQHISMSDYFYFNKGQRRGALLFILLVLVVIVLRWVL